MADLEILHYFPKKSVVHLLDPRIKLLALFAFCLMIFLLPPPSTGFLGLFLVFLLILSGLPALYFFKELKLVFVFLLITFLLRSMAREGEPLFQLFGILFTKGSVLTSAYFVWQLFILLWAALIFTGTTSLQEIQAALEWALTPIPFVNGFYVSVIISLTFGMIPLFFDEIQEIQEAQAARCVQKVKNPVKRIRFMVIPLLTTFLNRGEELALAMEARCFNENRTRFSLKITLKDRLALIILFLVVIAAYSVNLLLPGK